MGGFDKNLKGLSERLNLTKPRRRSYTRLSAVLHLIESQNAQAELIENKTEATVLEKKGGVCRCGVRFWLGDKSQR